MSQGMPNERRGLTLPDLVTIIVGGSVLFGILAVALLQFREMSRRNACANNLKQLGEAVMVYRDCWILFPSEGYDPATNTTGPAIRTTQLYVSLLPYLGQDYQYENALKENLKVLYSVNTFLCPARRSAVVGAKDDYAAPANGVASMGSRERQSILGNRYAEGIEYHRTLIQHIINFDGSAYTLLLGHKSLPTTAYHEAEAVTGDQRWFDISDPTDHNRLARLPGLAPHPTQDSPASTGLGFGSPHPGAMPTLFGDFSVRPFAYDRTAEVKGPPYAYDDGPNYHGLQSANVIWLLLCAWNDNHEFEASEWPR